MATIGVIAEFNTNEDWILYHERLEQFFEANDIKDTDTSKKKVAALLSLVGQAAYKTLKDLCTPTLPKDKTYDELCNILRTHFTPKTSVYRERIGFYDAKQEQKESVASWYARLKNLSINCDFGVNLENVLKDKFVCGMYKGPIRDKLCEEKGTVVLAKMLDLAQNKEINVKIKEESTAETSGETGLKWIKNQQRRSARTQRRHEDVNNVSQHSQHKGRKKCQACGRFHTGTQVCKYSKYECDLCHEIGHLAKVCNSSKRKVNQKKHHYLDVEIEDDSDEVPIYALDSKSDDSIMERVIIENRILEMELDSGSGVSAISKKLYNDKFTDCELKDSNIVLRGYSGERIAPVGYFECNIQYKSEVRENFEIQVIEGGGPPILGRNFMKSFDLKLTNEILNLKTDTDTNVTDTLVQKYANLFDGKLGRYKHKVFKLSLKPNAKPIFHKPRPVPIAFKPKIEAELKRLEDDGIISPVENSSWGTPIVPVLKSDGDIRICGDYKVTLNQFIEEVKYPLPRIDQIFQSLNGGVEFSKIDLNRAYNQLVLDEESAKITTWSTHKGLFNVNRLPFGVSPAGAIFQRLLEQIFQRLDGVANFLDDIIVTGKNREEHGRRLEKVFVKLQESGLKVKLSKCAFFQKEIRYLGHAISKEGLRKTDDKVRAIMEAPTPQNATQIKSFAGMVNYYGKFIPALSMIMRPIYDLLKKDTKFIWTDECSNAFAKIKQLVVSDKILMHFNPELPIVVTTDASQYGIAGALAHRLPGNIERPVAFVSRTYMPAEKNYSTIDREALAIYWTIKKWYQYLQGYSFILRTDHKPLLAIFGENKGIPLMAAGRLQRWAVYLSGFNYKIEYINGKSNVVADTLSRLPIEVHYLSRDYTECGTYLNFIQEEGTPINFKRIRQETRKDAVLARILEFVSVGWPEHVEEEELRPYMLRREQLTLEQGCLMWGYRTIIPAVLRESMLQVLHGTHMGMVKMKSLARTYMWWPKMDSDIEQLSRRCKPCLKNRPEPEKMELIPWSRPEKPWQRIHIDFLGPVKNKNFLIIVDAYSKWIETYKMNSTTSAATIANLRESFARWGIPEILVSDNGPQLVSAELEQFLTRNGIQHRTTAPGHPATNGAAENAVKTFKRGIKTALEDEKNTGTDLDILVNRFLLTYRNTPHCTTNESPSMLMMGRRLRCRLDLIKPSTNKVVKDKQRKQIEQYKGKRSQVLSLGQRVMVRDYRVVNKKTWQPAEVIQILGDRNYKCLLDDGQEWKRHINQITTCDLPKMTDNNKKIPDNNKKIPENNKKIPEVIKPRKDTRLAVLIEPNKSDTESSDTENDDNQTEFRDSLEGSNDEQTVDTDNLEASVVDETEQNVDIDNAEVSNKNLSKKNQTDETMSEVEDKDPDDNKTRVYPRRKRNPPKRFADE